MVLYLKFAHGSQFFVGKNGLQFFNSWNIKAKCKVVILFGTSCIFPIFSIFYFKYPLYFPSFPFFGKYFAIYSSDKSNSHSRPLFHFIFSPSSLFYLYQLYSLTWVTLINIIIPGGGGRVAIIILCWGIVISPHPNLCWKSLQSVNFSTFEHPVDLTPVCKLNFVCCG